MFRDYIIADMKLNTCGWTATGNILISLTGHCWISPYCKVYTSEIASGMARVIYNSDGYCVGSLRNLYNERWERVPIPEYAIPLMDSTLSA